MDSIEPVRDWLIGQGLLATPISDILPGLADRLISAGIPVARLQLSGTLLDPQFRAVSFSWSSADASQAEAHSFEDDETNQDWLTSPLNWVIGQSNVNLSARKPMEAGKDFVTWARFRLAQREGVDAFPVLRDFADRGYTDYAVYAIPYSFDGETAETLDEGVVGSWMTLEPSGFTDDQLTVLRGLTPLLGVAARSHVFYVSGLNLVRTYLGANAGERVITGSIRRGETSTIETAILLGDLRGFTRLSEHYDRHRLVRSLDAYLSCMAEPVQDHDGEVLKFLGDGLLASFALTDDDRVARCRSALAAAEDILAQIHALNLDRTEQGEPTMPVDLALHVGEVFYGNVGSERRLDFTVIGPAVNACSRMEAMCDRLGTPLIASAQFVEACGMGERFVSLGSQALRGVDTPRELFTLSHLAHTG